MGSVLLGIVARRNRDDLNNNNSDIGEFELAKEAHLLESPPIGIRYKPVNFKPELLTQKASKIGKIAKISDRKVSGDKFVLDNQVSESPTNVLIKLCGTGRLSVIKLRFKKNSRQLKKTLAVIRNGGNK